MIARSIMKRDVVSVKPDQSLRDAVLLMDKHRISGLPVIDDNGKVVGILSESDILRRGRKICRSDFEGIIEKLLYAQSPKSYEEELKCVLKLKVGDVMTEDVIAVKESTPVGEIAFLMIDKDINRIPVVKDQKIIGIIGREDIIKAIAKLCGTEEAAEA